MRYLIIFSFLFSCSNENQVYQCSGKKGTEVYYVVPFAYDNRYLYMDSENNVRFKQRFKRYNLNKKNIYAEGWDEYSKKYIDIQFDKGKEELKITYVTKEDVYTGCKFKENFDNIREIKKK